MKVTCHNKECRTELNEEFTFDYDGDELTIDCPRCTSRIVIDTQQKNIKNKSKIRNNLRNWLIKHPSINPYNFSKNNTLKKINASDRLLPNFLIFGGTRSGGTTLQRYIIKHPLVICERNIHFFENTFTNDLDWYRSHFPTKKYKKKIEKKYNQILQIGEQTGTYMFFPGVPKRVKEIIPDVKLIAVLRNPIDMVFSRYIHMKNQGLELSLSFDEAVRTELKRIELVEKKPEIKMNNPFFDNSMVFNYIKHGNYFERFQEWFKYFPKEQFLIFTNTELTGDPSGFTNKTLEFLNLEPRNMPDNIDYKKHNVSNYKEKMSGYAREILGDHFRSPNEKMSKLLNKNLEWK